MNTLSNSLLNKLNAYTFGIHDTLDHDFGELIISEFKTKRRLDKPVIPIQPKNNISRNQTCPCGSGKKYKKCCLK